MPIRICRLSFIEDRLCRCGMAGDAAVLWEGDGAQARHRPVIRTDHEENPRWLPPEDRSHREGAPDVRLRAFARGSEAGVSFRANQFVSSPFGEPTKDAPGVVTVRHGGVQRRETVCLALALDFDELIRACSVLKGARGVAIAADTG